MKKFLLALILCLVLVGCNTPKEEKSPAMSYEEYIAAEMNSTVTIEAYIQAKQAWWKDKAVLYLQDNDGAYFVYNLACTKEQYDNELANGNLIRVTGVKDHWAGEIEILGDQPGAEATWELVSTEKKIYEATNVNSLLGEDDLLVNKQNMLVSLTGLKVVAQADGTSPFYYKWDNSGVQGDDVYVSFSNGTVTITCCVESYLCGQDTPVYKACESLKVGDTVDIEGFLYWYEGPQPHLTNVVVK
jgi:DNA/RNA endonuclease YhcR with UshA esterase domain